MTLNQLIAEFQKASSSSNDAGVSRAGGRQVVHSNEKHTGPSDRVNSTSL